MPPRIRRQHPARRYAGNSNEKRQSLIRLVIDEGLELRVAARQLDLKPSTARNILKKFNEKGDMEATRKKSNGVPPKLTAQMKADLADLAEWVEEQPDITLKELKIKLQGTHNADVHITTISRALRSLKYVMKELRLAPVGRNTQE